MQFSEVLLIEPRPLIREALVHVCSNLEKPKLVKAKGLGARFLSDNSRAAFVNFEDFDPFAFKAFLANHKSAMNRILLYASTDSVSVRALGRQALLSGYRWIMIQVDSGSFKQGLESMLEGTSYHSPGLTDKPYRQVEEDADYSKRLSLREVEVLKHLAVGSSNREVAAQLGISVRTVETHRMRIKDKLEAKSFADMVRFALERKLVG